MEFKSKGVVLIIMIVVALALAGTGFSLFQREHAKNIDLTNKIDDLTSKQKITEAKLSEAQRSISNFETKLKEATTQITTLTSQLQDEKASKEEALARLSQMQDDLDQQKKLRSDLEKKLNKAQDDVRVIKTELKKIDSEKVKLESKVKNLEKPDVELGKIVVSPESNQAQGASQENKNVKPAVSTAAQGLEGKVLVLNKEYNFVVINLGAKDGLAAGDQFAVYHGDSYIGDIKVEQVQDVMSAAGFTSGDLKNKVKEGDRVVKKSK